MKVTALYVYPVKGLRGIPLQSATIGPQGVRYDRNFMLMTAHRSKAGLTKMQLAAYPECALFSQEIEDGEIVVHHHATDETKQAPSPLRIPLEPPTASLAPATANLHGSSTTGCRMGAAYDAWFSACFGFDVILVYIGAGRRPVLGEALKPKRQTEKKENLNLLASSRLDWAMVAAVPILVPVLLLLGWMAAMACVAVAVAAGVRSQQMRRQSRQQAEPWLTFTDCAPLLVTAEASRENVNRRLSGDVAVPMYKFRPNVVVDGEDEWAEDFWAELGVGQGMDGDNGNSNSPRFRLLLTSNCARCVSLNVDYNTGAPAVGELGQVLKRMSRDRRVDAGMKYSPVFGRYAFLDGDDEVSISVGDTVAVTRRNKEHTVFDWPGL